MRLRNLLELQEEFDRAFREARMWQGSHATGPGFDPPTDVSRGEKAYYVRLDLPGVTRDQVRVHADNSGISVSGSKAAPKPDRGELLRGERQYGRFLRLVSLPSDADLGDVRATLRDGVLHIRVARVGSRGGQRVEVVVE